MKKYALVIGASGAIGSAIVKRLAADGWSLYLHFNVSKESIEQLLAELTPLYEQQEFFAVQSDFTLDGAAEHLASQLFTVNAIVFAGGHSYYGLLEETPVEEMSRLWKVHVQNPMRLVGLLSSKLRMHEKSYILFIGSIWGEAGAAYETVYSAVKGAQHAFVKSYAKEAAFNHILVNAIAPGFIDTRMNKHLSNEERQELFNEIPLGKAGSTEHVANLVGFYLSGQADYVTGQIIRINGGWYI